MRVALLASLVLVTVVVIMTMRMRVPVVRVRMTAAVRARFRLERRLFLEDNPIGRSVAEEHRRICEAATERRADEACRLLRGHIERTGRLVRAALSEKTLTT